MQINRRYPRHLEVLDRCPAGELADADAAKSLRRWAADEREAWLTAVQSDPLLLLERLLPTEYFGRRAWEPRKTVLGRTGERLRPSQWRHHSFVAGATKDSINQQYLNAIRWKMRATA